MEYLSAYKRKSRGESRGILAHGVITPKTYHHGSRWHIILWAVLIRGLKYRLLTKCCKLIHFYSRK